MKKIGFLFLMARLCFAMETLEYGPQLPPQVRSQTDLETEVPAPTPVPIPTIENKSPWRGALEFGGTGAFSTVEDQPDYSGGLGWNVGLQAEYRTPRSFRFTGSLGYQSLTITKFIASSGGVILDQFSEYQQTQTGPYGQILFGQRVLQSGPKSREPFELFVDLGVEYFHGLNARQTTSFNTVNEFTPSKFLFAVGGVSVAWRIRGDWELQGHGRFFINTAGESQWRLMGGRLTLALSIPL